MPGRSTPCILHGTAGGIRVFREEFGQHVVVLPRQVRTSSVQQQSSGGQQRPQRIQQAGLPGGQRRDVSGAALYLDIGVTADDSRTAAGRVHQDAMEYFAIPPGVRLAGIGGDERRGETQAFDIVGPVCETGDFLGKDRQLNLLGGDLLAVRSSGAYGFVMASNYNSRPRAAEVMVDGDQDYLIREREKLPQLWQGEHLLP